MFSTIVFTTSLIAIVVSMTAISLHLVGVRVSNRCSDMRNWEIDTHRRKLGQWVYHFMACGNLIGAYFFAFWFFYLNSAIENSSLSEALMEAPPITVFISIISVGYVITFLVCASWHLYSISRGFRNVRKRRFRDKLIAHIQVAMENVSGAKLADDELPNLDEDQNQKKKDLAA